MLGEMLAFFGTYSRTLLFTSSVAWRREKSPFLLLYGAIVLVDKLLSRGFRFLKHWGVRGLLVGAGVAPWRYGTFLDAMTERLLLRRSGYWLRLRPRPAPRLLHRPRLGRPGR